MFHLLVLGCLVVSFDLIGFGFWVAGYIVS